MGNYWVVIFAIFLIAEIATAGALVSVWFCVGALAALAAANAGVSLLGQLTVFVVISTALLVMTKPFVKKVMNNKRVRTNADRIIGGKGIVTEEIDNLKGTGAVRIDGKVWTARSLEEPQVFAVGTEVIIAEIRGVKAMVQLENLKGVL